MTLEQTRAQYQALLSQNLKLNMQRGQPASANFDLSNDMVTALGTGDLETDGLDLRNYPGGVAGLPSARALFAEYLEVAPENVVVWNNSSLELQGLVLTFALLHGLPASTGPWVMQKPRMIVTTPGYDRHFALLETLGFELLTVPMQPDGPDMAAIRTHAQDERVKGILFVPTYSNPSGESISPEKARELVALQAAAPDFTIFADDAYRVHHLYDERDQAVNLIELCREAGHPNRAFVFSSTSKITFASAGLGFMASSVENIKWLSRYLNAQSIGPNKIEQARHVRFLREYPGGIDGLMRQHAAINAPKFDAVDKVLRQQLGTDGRYATWTKPRGGYFISLNTTAPVARRVVELAEAAGVSVTPAGSTFPAGQDTENRNIRLAPTRPPLHEVEQAMRVLALAIQLATEEFEAQKD